MDKNNVRENKLVEHQLNSMADIANGRSIPTPLAKYLARSVDGEDIIYIGHQAGEILSALLAAGKTVTAIVSGDIKSDKFDPSSNDQLTLNYGPVMDYLDDITGDHLILDPVATADENDPLKSLNLSNLNDVINQSDVDKITIKFSGEVDIDTLENKMGDDVQVREFLFGIGVLFFTATADKNAWANLIGKGA